MYAPGQQIDGPTLGTGWEKFQREELVFGFNPGCDFVNQSCFISVERDWGSTP